MTSKCWVSNVVSSDIRRSKATLGLEVHLCNGFRRIVMDRDFFGSRWDQSREMISGITNG